jgi:hypothetical protein
MNVFYYFRKNLLDENAKRMSEVFYRALSQQVQGRSS